MPVNHVEVTRTTSGIDVRAASALEAWECLDPLQYTPDGGRTWRTVSDPRCAKAPTDAARVCAAVPGGDAWELRIGADNDVTILRVRHWTDTRVIPLDALHLSPTTSILSMTFIDAKHGWITTDDESFLYGPASGPLYRTRDGGDSWELVARFAPVGASVQFTSATRGWALASPIGLMTTADGGATWHRANLPEAAGSVLVTVVARAGVVIALRSATSGGSSRPLFDVSTDDGRTWVRRRAPNALLLTGASPFGFAAADASHWRLLARQLWITNDGGRTWAARAQPPVEAVDAMAFTTPAVGWISGSPGASASPVALRTTDGGRTWSDLTAARPVPTPPGPGGLVACPSGPLTPAPPGDPRPGLVSAAIDQLSAGSLWTGATISAVYRVGDERVGEFGSAFVANVSSCPRAAAASSWVVELHHPNGAQLSAVVLAHYAGGWRVYGSYP